MSNSHSVTSEAYMANYRRYKEVEVKCALCNQIWSNIGRVPEFSLF